MKNFARLKILILTVAVLLFACASADAQKRRPTRKTAKPTTAKTTKASAATAINTIALDEGSLIISNQIKNLGQFLYVYGNSVSRIESIDTEARAGKLSEDARKQSEIGKQGLVLTVRTFKNAMLKLEDDFRAKPGLRPYLLQLTGVGETASLAEEQAAAGQFQRAGRTLLEVLNQLTDTLKAMP